MDPVGSDCRPYSVVKYSTSRALSRMYIREVFARNLRRYRRAARLSQEEFAHRSDIDRTYISSLERSVYAASIDVVDRLAAALEIQAADLLVRPPSARARKSAVLDGER
jgi:transcriptional regulator with XRE-family HTH domain